MSALHSKQKEAFDHMVMTSLEGVAPLISKSTGHNSDNSAPVEAKSVNKDHYSDKDNEALKQFLIDNFYEMNLSKYWWCDSEEEQVRLNLDMVMSDQHYYIFYNQLPIIKRCLFCF